jgi:hypothetical protein
LALLLSQPQPVRRLFTLKMLARFALLGGLVLLLLLPMLLASGVSTEQAGVWQFVGLMLLYALFWFLFALAINLLGKNSQFNALACVGGWLLFAVVVPSLANLLAERLHPLPSRADYLNEMRDLEKTVEAKRAELVDQLYRDHPQMPRKAEGQEKTWSEEYREEMAVMDFEQGLRREVEARHDRAVERQADFLQSFAAWSPLLAAHEQMTELAGTSRRALQASQTQVRAEQSKWAAFFREKIDKGQDLTVADYHAIEQFPAQIRAAAQNSSSGWLWLLAQCAVAAGVVFWIGRHSRSSLAIS